MKRVLVVVATLAASALAWVLLWPVGIVYGCGFRDADPMVSKYCPPPAAHPANSLGGSLLAAPFALAVVVAVLLVVLAVGVVLLVRTRPSRLAAA